MKRIRIILSVLIAGALLASCSSSIRFSSNGETAGKRAVAKASVKSDIKQKDKEINITRIAVPKSLAQHSTQNDLIETANKLLGTPYCYGGQSYDCTDCSGFVLQVYSSVGIDLPRTAALQYEYAQEISGDPEIGDLVFFSGNGKDITHVGIYIGSGEFVHASTSNGVMRSALTDAYYHDHFAGYKRIPKLYSGI